MMKKDEKKKIKDSLMVWMKKLSMTLNRIKNYKHKKR
jgi:hypothetical protein